MKYLSLLLLLLIGCTSTEPVIEANQVETDITSEETQTPSSDAQSVIDESSNQEIKEEYPYLSSLSDTYFNRQNIIPEAYARIKAEIEEEEVDLFEGYRVQIYSGPNVALADTTAKRFRAWSAERIEGYQAETYTEFRAPNYRVHVGDFHDRNKAIEFSNLLKRRFRDSWVVYDRINPFNVPSDTTQIIYLR